MKYLFFLLIVMPVLTYSQSIFTGNMLWSTMDGPGNCCNGDPCKSYYTKIANDTTINGIQYKWVLNSTDSLMNEWKFKGFIREEGQKVFYRKKNADTECLLYDFGCSIGDTLNLDCSCPYYHKFKVDSIKYQTVMGENRKHIYLTYLINDTIEGPLEYWIEGIGSIFGILNGGGANNCAVGSYEKLLCCFKDSKKIYIAPGCNDCYIESKDVNSLYEYSTKNRFLKLYPNPASEYIYIQNKAKRNYIEIEVLSLEGNILIRNKIIDNKEKIDIRNLNSGLYIVKLKDTHGFVYSKFIKQ